jgi:hypothetical protein
MPTQFRLEGVRVEITWETYVYVRCTAEKTALEVQVCDMRYYLKGWNSSNIWEQPKRIKILFVKKLRAGRSRGMLAITRCRNVVLQFAVQKYED